MKLFLASHGRLASGLLNSAEILFGSTGDKLTVYDAYLDETSIQDVLDAFFASVSEDEQVILLSDLYGGSVNQIMVQYLQRDNTYLVSGVNLALVLELIASTSDLSKEELSQIVQQSREMLRLVELNTLELIIEEEDDFF